METVYVFCTNITSVIKWLVGSGVFGYVSLKILKWLKPELSLSLASITGYFNFYINPQINNSKHQENSSIINKQSEWAEQALNLVDEYLREMREWFDYMYIQDLRECYKKFRSIQNILQKVKDLILRLEDKDSIIPIVDELEVAVRGLPGSLDAINRNNFPTHLVLKATDRLHNAPSIVESYVTSIRGELIKIVEK